MAATNRRQLLTGAAAYAAGAAIVAGGVALASEAKGATISPGLAAAIANTIGRDAIVDQHQRLVLDNAVGREAINAALDANNALNDEWAESLDAVAAYPVDTVTDLRAKLAFMLEHEMGDGRDWLEEINADVLRIAAAGEAQA